MGVTRSRVCRRLHAHDLHIHHVLWLILNVFKNSNMRPLYRDTVPLNDDAHVPPVLLNPVIGFLLVIPFSNLLIRLQLHLSIQNNMPYSSIMQWLLLTCA